jgi:hypothetical protein
MLHNKVVYVVSIFDTGKLTNIFNIPNVFPPHNIPNVSYAVYAVNTANAFCLNS